MALRTFERRLAQRGQLVLACSVLVFILACWGAVHVGRTWRNDVGYVNAAMRRALASLTPSLDAAMRPALLTCARDGFTVTSAFTCLRIEGNDGTPLWPRSPCRPVPPCVPQYAPLVRSYVDRAAMAQLDMAMITNPPLADMPHVPGANAVVGIELGWRIAIDAIASSDLRRARAAYQLMRDQFPVQFDLAGFPVRLAAWLEDIRWCSDKDEQMRHLEAWRDELVGKWWFTNTPQARAVVGALLRRASDIAGGDADLLALTNAVFPSALPTCVLRDDRAVYRMWLDPDRTVKLAESCWPVRSPHHTGILTHLHAPGNLVSTGVEATTNVFGICLTVEPHDGKALLARQTRNSLFNLVLLGGVMIASAGLFWRTLMAMAAEKRLKSRELNFVAAVSHELRSPISSVKVLAEAMERGLVTDPREQQTFARMIVDESDRLTRLVNNILDVARGPSADLATRKEPLTVRALLDSAARVPAGMPDTRISVVCPDNLVVAGVKALIERAICNLVENALKYRRRDGACVVELSARAVDALVEIRVADNGIGIPRHEHERIFEQFYRVGDELVREHSGAGLGLAIVKEIVEAHGGSVAVESTVGTGSSFIVRLPL